MQRTVGRFLPSVLFVVIALHLASGAVWITGTSLAAITTCIVLYFAKAFALEMGFHRFFSHGSFKTSRAFQFMLALIGILAIQGGPIGWARNHRHHHKYSDKDGDIHSPRHGFFWAHMGSAFFSRDVEVDRSTTLRLHRNWELVMLDRFNYVIAFLGQPAVLFWFGDALGARFNTSGTQMVIWGMVVSSVLGWHAVGTINSLLHSRGTRSFDLDDNSRNSLWLSLVLVGGSWHNNHHRYPGLARCGLEWWQFDPTFYLLKLLQKLGVVWDVRELPYQKRAPLVTTPLNNG